MARDGRRLVVSVPTHSRPKFDGMLLPPDDPTNETPIHPSTYLYDCQTDEALELRPVFEGKTWRLVGHAALSPDGRFVAATCLPEADDEVLNEIGWCRTVALVDTTGNESRLIDLKALGIRAPVGTFAPSLSRHAEFVAIPTTPDYGSGIEHGWTMLWSHEGGIVGAAKLGDEYFGSQNPRISDDGRFLVVESLSHDAETYPPGAFLMDLRSNLPGVTPAWPGGHVFLSGWSCSLSGDGRRVAFHGKTPADLPEPHPDDSLFLYDTASRATTLVNGGPGLAGVMTLGFSLSGSGEYLAFAKGGDLTADVPFEVVGLYVQELSSGRTVRVNGELDVGRVDIGFRSPAISEDGRRVACIRLFVLRGDGHRLGEASREVVLADLDW